MANQAGIRDLNDLTRSVLYEEVPNQNLMRLTAIVIGTASLLFIVWASVTSVNEIARTPGEIIPSGYAQVVQHLEGGIVSQILVSEGDLVDRDQVLIGMSVVGAKEDLASLHDKQTALLLQAARLRALADGKEPNFSQVEGVGATAIAYQQNLLDSARQANDSERSVLVNQLAQKRQAVDSLNAQGGAAQKQVKSLREILAMKQGLADRGSVARKDVIESELDVTRVEGQANALQAQLEEARNAIDEYQSRLKTLDAKNRDQALKQLEDIETQIAQNKETLGKLESRVDRMAVRAPVRGIVKGLRVNTIGGVVSPGQPVMEIVPLDRTLVVEVHIAPRDIGNLRVGQPARVKVSSYDFSRFGVIDGTLDFLSATTFNDDKQNSYYKGRILLGQDHVGPDPKRNLILPGMTVEADIVTGEKSVLAYLLKPISLALNSAFHER